MDLSYNIILWSSFTYELDSYTVKFANIVLSLSSALSL